MITAAGAMKSARSGPEIPSLVTRPDGPGARRDLTTRLALGEAREGLQQRLETLADDVDAFWRASVECGEFNLVSTSGEASHAVHRAIAALADHHGSGISGGLRP